MQRILERLPTAGEDALWGYEETTGLYLPRTMLMEVELTPPQLKPRLVAIDLFAGCGGFSLGVEQAGIDVVVAVELDFTAACTYAFNLGARGGRFVFQTAELEEAFRKFCKKFKDEPNPLDENYFGYNRPKIANGSTEPFNSPPLDPDGGCRALLIGDVTKVNGSQLIELARLRTNEKLVAVIGGPPCQSFSRAGRQDPADPRSNLILEFLRIGIETDATYIFMENVPPLLTEKKFRELWIKWVQVANDSGRTVVANVIDAAAYGVPQRRRRAFAVASKEGHVYHFPMPTHWPAVYRPDGEVLEQGYFTDDEGGENEGDEPEQISFDF